MVLRAVKEIKQGDELFHSYIDVCIPTYDRQRVLEAEYCFVCKCERCEDGGGRGVDVGERGGEAGPQGLDAQLAGYLPQAPSISTRETDLALATHMHSEAVLKGKGGGRKEKGERGKVGGGEGGLATIKKPIIILG